MKPAHTIKDISFANDYLVCTCEQRMTPADYPAHRASAGAKPGNAGHIHATEDDGMPFTPAHGPGIQVTRPGRPRIRTGDGPCLRGHTGEWKARSRDGVLMCARCTRDLQRERRKAVAA